MANGNGNGEGSKWASRKFFLVVGVFLVTTILLVSTGGGKSFISESTWLTVTLGVIGAYITGNVVQRALTQ